MSRNITLLLRSGCGYDVRTVTSLEIKWRPVEIACGSGVGDPPTEVGIKFEPMEPRLGDGAVVFMALD